MSQLHSSLGARREQLGPRMVRVPELVAPLAHLLIRREDRGTSCAPSRGSGPRRAASRRPRRAPGPRSAARAGRRARRCRSPARRALAPANAGAPARLRARLEAAVVGRSRDGEHRARQHDADQRRELAYGAHDDLLVLSSSSGIVGSVTPKSCETFFWTSQMSCSFAFSALQPRDLALLLGELLGERVRLPCAFGPRFFGSSPASSPRSRSTPPLDQMRRVQPLAPKQRADLAGLRAGVGLLQDLPSCTRR